MKGLVSALLVFLFANGQAFADICTNLCVQNENFRENQSQIITQSFKHACCNRVEKKTEEKQSHDCSSEYCMTSIPLVETPLLTAKTEIKKKLVNPYPTVEIGTQFLLAKLSNKILSLNQSELYYLTPKVPFYIYYQELLK